MCWCRQVTDKGLEAISSGCTSLLSLYIDYASRVTDVGLVAISSKCLSLTTLHMYGCGMATDKGIAAITSRCRNLVSLGCDAIRTQRRETLRVSRPKLVIKELYHQWP